MKTNLNDVRRSLLDLGVGKGLISRLFNALNRNKDEAVVYAILNSLFKNICALKKQEILQMKKFTKDVEKLTEDFNSAVELKKIEKEMDAA